MKNSLVFLMFSFHLCISGQTNIETKWPLDSNLIYINSYESKSGKLYVGKENKFRITVPNAKTRNIELVFDTANINFETNWRPINADKKWYEPLAEYTLMSAKKIGAYRPEMTNDQSKYIDTNGIYWEKEYMINPKIAQQFNITLYLYKADSLKELHNSFQLYSRYIPTPTLDILTFQQLLSVKRLVPNIDPDLRNGQNWFQVRSYKFTTYDKKNQVIFEATCNGDILLSSMIQSLENKKTKYLILSNIVSKEHNYKDIKLFVK